MSDQSNSVDRAAMTTMHVRRAIDGDNDSLAWLVTRISPLLRAQARYRLGVSLARRYEPDELVHEAWLVALPRLAGLPARDGRHTPVLLRFLSTTLLNRINNLVRKHVREDDASGVSGTGDGPPPTVSEVPAECSGVISRVLRHEREETVQRVLDELDERDREVILLRGTEQLPTQAVGMLLDVSPEAVSMRYVRALRRLRSRLPGSVFDELDED